MAIPACLRLWHHENKTSTRSQDGFAGRVALYISLMCGRDTRKYTWAEIHAMYNLLTPAAIPNMQPSYNICPTDPHDTIVEHEGERQLEVMRWGIIPYWWQKSVKEAGKLASFNARVETVTTKPFFREPFKKRRCLMPVSGYYEWQDTPHGKQPWYFTASDKTPILTIAGIWDSWKNRETGERMKSCAMIIGEPNDFVPKSMIECRCCCGPISSIIG